MEATEVELYDFIVDFIRGEKLQSLEDQGMARLLTLHDLVRELTSTEKGFASNIEENDISSCQGAGSTNYRSDIKCKS